MGKPRFTREQIVSAPSVGETEVAVPEWGEGTVLVSGMTLRDRVQVRKEALVEGKFDEERFEVLLFIHCVREPKFTMEDFDVLRAKSPTAMDRVLNVIYQSAGMQKEEAKAIETSFPAGA